MLRVLSLNMWDTYEYPRERLRRLVGWLQQVRPDVVALQEVAVVDGRWQSDRLADRAGYSTVLTVDLAGSEGLAVLADAPARLAPTVTLPEVAGDARRLLQQVDVDIEDVPVRVANTHWAWRLGDTTGRVHQAQAVAAALVEVERPVVLCGDLNDVPGSAPLEVLEAAGLVETFTAAGADERPTFDAANPYAWQEELLGRRVDHVFVSAGMRVGGAQVVLDGEEGPVVSDHYGVAVEIHLRPGAESAGADSAWQPRA